MILAQMRFNDFTWFHNPKEIKITDEKQMNENLSPYSSAQIQNFGRKCKVVYGVGELFGSTCIKQYEKLYELFCKNAAGILSVPDLPPMLAYFEQLSVVEDTTPNVITYKFKFRECDTNNTCFNSLPDRHTVISGETLWDIAYTYNTTVERLVELNPNIKRPDVLTENESVRIC